MHQSNFISCNGATTAVRARVATLVRDEATAVPVALTKMPGTMVRVPISSMRMVLLVIAGDWLACADSDI